MQPPPMPRKPNPGSSPHSKSTAMPVVPPPLLPARTSLLPWICLSLTLMLFGVVGAGVLWHSLSGPRKVNEVASSDDHEFELMPASSRPDAQLDESVSDADSNDMLPKTAGRPTDEMPTTASSKSAFDPASNSVEFNSTSERVPVSNPVVATARSAIVPPPETPEVFADLRSRNFQLELARRGAIRDATEVKLATIHVTAEESLQLALSGGTDSGLKLVPQTGNATDVPTWTVLKQARAAFGGQEEVTLGQFLHKDGELRFQWNSAAPAWAKPGSLQFALLEVRVGTHCQLCQLWKPVTVVPTRINHKESMTVVVPFGENLIDRREAFRVQFQLSGTSQADAPSATVAIGETATLTVGESPEDGVEIELKIVPGDDSSSLQVKLFGSPPVKGKNGELRGARQEITQKGVEGHLNKTKVKDSQKKVIETLRTRSANLQKNITQKETQQQNANVALQNRFDQELAGLNQQSSDLESKLSKLETDLTAAQELADKNAAWCEGVLKQLKVLEEERTKLRYAIYVESQQRIVVIETSGFEWNKP